MPKAPLKLNELLKRLKGFGVVAMASTRGKGSEIILVKPIALGSGKGPQYPAKKSRQGNINIHSGHHCSAAEISD